MYYNLAIALCQLLDNDPLLGQPQPNLSFTGTLNIVRRALPKFQRLQIEEFPFFSPG
ncbi:hypothetical protein [Nostoc sp. CMAA1605]|uniref:hypothetical protein n=1 Tax=Nostoc sp. CMAA1605 TaxID=2055159 RepID=UPI001F3F7B1D|nr:hypothetical protein [Nostoc sp. CMAA1605]